MSRSRPRNNYTAQDYRRRINRTYKKRKILIDLYGSVCLCCRNPLTDAQITLDHVVPASKGGVQDITNLQILCAECNNNKGNRIGDYRPWSIVKYIIDNKDKIYAGYAKKT